MNNLWLIINMEKYLSTAMIMRKISFQEKIKLLVLTKEFY